MEPAVLRRTQESLGKVIRKPPLTDKLLGKPPFRYLHDILTEVIRTTGFLKGLYTESDLKSDNVKDKDAKISFLQKAIDVVVLVTGEPLAVKPARVVAGHEPEKTNEFLQAIGKCCLNKLSSEDAVKRVLSGEKVDLKGKPPLSSKSQDKENREAKDEERRSQREKEDRRETEIRERSGSRDKIDKQLKEEERKHSERERKKERERVGETERDGLREGEKNEKEKNKVRESRSETDKNRSKEKSEHERGREKERRNEGSHGKEKDRTRDKEKVREKDPEKEREPEDRNRERDRDHRERNRDRDQEKSRSRDHDKERRREKDAERARRKDRRDNEYQSGKEEKPLEEERTERKHKASEETTKKTPEISARENKIVADKEKPSVPSKSARPSASKLRERKPAKLSGEGSVQKHSKSRQQSFKRKESTSKAQTAESVTEAKTARELDSAPKRFLVKTTVGDSASDEEGGTTEIQNSESNAVSDAQTNISAQRRIPRPGSARPAPPRVKRQGSVEVIAPERISSGKGISSVIVDKQKNDGDDDDNEFVVEEAPPQLSEMADMQLEPELDLDEKHGSLVKKILETKKDYETQGDAVSKDKLILSDTGRKKEKDMVMKEIEKLRSSIQIVCRSALPLGKIMDYIQEDMDTMQNELQTWRRENREHADVLLKEQSVTDTAVEPLKAELAELEQLIKEQRDKICTVKGNILRNEDKIQKMAQSINVSTRE
ncbi:TRAF3-interacting protein 1 isoform X2 [Mixophyes fleayi]|uniref:TRAF3-interacting protein 1 isoform X2 n=1 Tax=Mixophyes fleayi TaxID=3061075 RepID=UPI003F4D9465